MPATNINLPTRIIRRVRYEYEIVISKINYRLYLKNLKRYNYKGKDVIFFYMHPILDIRSGGILSIYFLLDVTAKYLKDAIVEPATIHKRPTYTKANWFDNDKNIYNILYLQKELLKTSNLIVHVPEGLYIEFCDLITQNKMFHLAKHMSVNILNQNATMAPSEKEIGQGTNLFGKVTMTLAFEINKSTRYESLSSDPYFISSWFYKYTIEEVAFEEKEDICLVSPDNHIDKKKIVAKLESECGVKCIEIINMRFEEFQSLQKRAKWGISFGEGFDNYFGGPFLKDGVGFSVYNRTFFPKNFLEDELPQTVFKSYDLLNDGIVEVLNNLNSKTKYEKYVAQMKRIVLTHNSPEIVIEKLLYFYSQELGEVSNSEDCSN